MATSARPLLNKAFTPVRLPTQIARNNPELNPIDHAKLNLGTRIFIVISIAVAAVLVITAILAILASKGIPPGTLESVSRLSVIGEVNSYVMLAGGLALLILGIVAWGRQLHKEDKQLPPPAKRKLVFKA